MVGIDHASRGHEFLRGVVALRVNGRARERQLIVGVPPRAIGRHFRRRRRRAGDFGFPLLSRLFGGDVSGNGVADACRVLGQLRMARLDQSRRVDEFFGGVVALVLDGSRRQGQLRVGVPPRALRRLRGECRLALGRLTRRLGFAFPSRLFGRRVSGDGVSDSRDPRREVRVTRIDLAGGLHELSGGVVTLVLDGRRSKRQLGAGVAPGAGRRFSCESRLALGRLVGRLGFPIPSRLLGRRVSGNRVSDSLAPRRQVRMSRIDLARLVDQVLGGLVTFLANGRRSQGQLRVGVPPREGRGLGLGGGREASGVGGFRTQFLERFRDQLVRRRERGQQLQSFIALARVPGGLRICHGLLCAALQVAQPEGLGTRSDNLRLQIERLARLRCKRQRFFHVAQRRRKVLVFQGRLRARELGRGLASHFRLTLALGLGRAADPAAA